MQQFDWLIDWLVFWSNISSFPAMHNTMAKEKGQKDKTTIYKTYT